MSETDLVLLDRWRAGDRVAGSELFDRHFPALYRFFRNKADDGFEDLIQQTFLDCLESRDQFRADSSFRTFLFVIARRVLFDYWSKRRRAPIMEDISAISVAAMSTSPLDVVIRKRQHLLVARALRAIPLDLQIAVELHYWELLSGSEMAEVLGVPEGTARSRLRRGLEQLREKLDQLARGGMEDVLSSTALNLDEWAASLRECFAARRTGE